MAIKFKTCLLVLLVALLCCKSKDRRQETRDAKQVYTEYSFWGEEEKEFITGLFQFRQEGESSRPSKLEAPATVALDGVNLEADSAEITGTFYEIHKPLESFSGKHNITFTAEDGEQHTETFTFNPFQLSAEPGEAISRKQMVFSFTGFEDEDWVRGSNYRHFI
jgi:hypothetical protein